MKLHRLVLSAGLAIGLLQPVLAQSIWNGSSVATSFHSGSGTESDPYLIYTPGQLAYFFQQISTGNQFASKYVKVMSDINLSSHDVHANGTFSGTLDGGNHWITGYDCETGSSTASNHAYGCFISKVNGTIHNLAISGRTSGSYSTFSAAEMAITETLEQSGHIYNCVYSISCSNYAGSAGTMAYFNYGTIENCYAYGSYHTRFDGTDARAFGAICFENKSTGIINNCKYSFNDASYGGVFAETAQASASPTDRRNSGIIDPFTGNDWVSIHTDYDYSTWSGKYGLTCFDPDAVSQCTITFFDELNLSSVPSFTIEKGMLIGELPQPTSEKTFSGWYRNNVLVTPSDIVESDWLLCAKWQNCVRNQPTTSNTTFDVDDASNASFQWFEKFENERICYNDWNSGVTADGETSKTSITVNAIAGMNLSFDWRVSSEDDYDYIYVQVNGKTILTKSGEGFGTCSYSFIADGEYTITFKYTKDSSNAVGSDKAWFSNISVGYENTALADARTSTLPEKYRQKDGTYYCVATYNDGTNELRSDDVIFVITPCEKPSILFQNNQLSFCCSTVDAVIHWNVSAPVVQLQGTGMTLSDEINEALANASITISAYATAPGFGRSEIATRVFNLSNLYDLNGDGEINVADVTTIANAILTQESK